MIEIVPKRDFQERTCTFYIYPPLVWTMMIILSWTFLPATFFDLTAFLTPKEHHSVWTTDITTTIMTIQTRTGVVEDSERGSNLYIRGTSENPSCKFLGVSQGKGGSTDPPPLSPTPSPTWLCHRRQWTLEMCQLTSFIQIFRNSF